MWNTISNTPPCSGFLARENQEKAWTDILYKEEVKEDIDYQIAGVTCKS